VERLRKEYSWEDKELIEKLLEAKKGFNSKSECLVQEPEGGLPGKLSIHILSIHYKE
jgi:hypothetical protein